jgi:hypothetical protein
VKSSGRGASNFTHSFVLGWKTPSFHAWNICSSTVAPRPADGMDVKDGFVSPGRRARDDNGVPSDPETWKIDWQQTGARLGRPRPLSRCGRGRPRCGPVPSFLASGVPTWCG